MARQNKNGYYININGSIGEKYEKIGLFQSTEAFTSHEENPGSEQITLHLGAQVGRVRWPVSDNAKMNADSFNSDAFPARLATTENIVALETSTDTISDKYLRPLEIGQNVEFADGITPPAGADLVVLRGTKLGTLENNIAFAPNYGMKLVAHHLPDSQPQHSSQVLDMDGPEASKIRVAGLHSATRVKQLGKFDQLGLKDHAFALASNFTKSGGLEANGSTTGFGLAVFKSKSKKRTAVRGTNTLQTLAFRSQEANGPLTAGHSEKDKHQFFQNKDGEFCNSAHIHTNAYYTNDSVKFDAPLKFEFADVPETQEGIFPVKCHLQFNPDADHDWQGKTRKGRWEWWTSVFWEPVRYDTVPPFETIREPLEIEIPSTFYRGDSHITAHDGGGGVGGGDGDGSGDGSGSGSGDGSSGDGGSDGGSGLSVNFQNGDSATAGGPVITGTDREAKKRAKARRAKRIRDSIIPGYVDYATIPNVGHISALAYESEDGLGFQYTNEAIMNESGVSSQMPTASGILAFGPPELYRGRMHKLNADIPDNVSDLSVMLWGDTKLGFGYAADNGKDVVSGWTIQRDTNGFLAIDVLDSAGATDTSKSLKVCSSLRLCGNAAFEDDGILTAIASSGETGHSVSVLGGPSGSAPYDGGDLILGGGSSGGTGGSVCIDGGLGSSVDGDIYIGKNRGKLSFFNATPQAKPEITGSRSDDLQSVLSQLLTAFDDYGLITNSTTA